jgi:predicted nuclease of predicted toxin-antitoxin system
LSRLLFDENLSPDLPALLREIFPNAVHVRNVGLERADDLVVWEHARAHRLAIVTKDDDFRQRSFLHGAPPKVIWVRLGNCRTAAVAALLSERADSLRRFLADETGSLLVLRPAP